MKKHSEAASSRSRETSSGLPLWRAPTFPPTGPKLPIAA
jgi:hypothetical protein